MGAGFTHAVLLGMGGSSLFPEVCRLTFGVAPGGVDVGVLDSTDPAAIRALERRAPLERTLAERKLARVRRLVDAAP